MKYKALFIDDNIESKEINFFILRAKRLGIEIIGEKFHEDGIKRLEEDKNYEIQAVILDAAGYKNEEDLNKTINNSGLYSSLRKLDKLQAFRRIPWFIFTGEANSMNTDEFTGTIKEFQKDYKYGRVDKIYYTKSEDDSELLEDIKFEIDNIENTNIYYQHKDVFTACEQLDIQKEHHDNIIRFIKDLDEKQSAESFNLIRKVIESIFKKLSDKNLVPKAIFNNKGWITGIYKFIVNEHDDFKLLNTEFYHPTIHEILRRTLNITQDGSHQEGWLNHRVSEFSNQQKTGYLYKSTIYALLDLIIYFGDFYINNPLPDLNILKWEKIVADWREGDVSEIKSDNWGTFICNETKDEIGIHPNTKKKYNIQVEEKLRIRVELNKNKNKLHIKDVVTL